MTDPSTRLVRALEIYLAWQRSGASRESLLAAHPEHADLLASFLDDPTSAGADDDGVDPQQIGPYRIDAELGRGGVGVVFAAYQSALDRHVALKVLHAEFAGRPVTLARFRREALALARLDHRGVVRIFDVGEHDGRPWIAMERIEGTTLADRIVELRDSGGHRGDSLRAMLQAVATIADALQHVHDAGLLHRDVKPSNVLLRADGSAVLGDFGLARDADDPTLTRIGVAAGTPHYMAPERIRNGVDGVDVRSDVFSLGATLYECVTLERAFDGTDTELVLQRILSRDPPDPRRGRRWLPRDLAAITTKAIEKDPALRYATARAFAEDLVAFLDLRPIRARPPSVARRVVRGVRRQPWTAVAVVAVLFAVTVGAIGLARLPDLRRGEAVAREASYEDALGDVLLALGGRDRAAAEAHLARAEELFADRVETWVHRTVLVRKFEGAAAALAFADRSPPRDAAGAPEPLVRRMRAILLRDVGDAAAADATAAELGPARTATELWLEALHRSIASTSVAGYREALALASLATRIANAPRLMLHVQWAACARVSGDAAAQRESADALLRLWPEHPLALHYAAANLQDVDAARAAELQRKAVDAGLKDTFGVANLGVYLFRAGQREAGIATMERALAAQPETRTHSRYVSMLLAIGATERAATAVDAWLAAFPDDADALQAAGRVAAQAGDFAKAIPYFERATKLRPTDHEAAYNLAVALDLAEDPRAVDQLAHVFTLEPANDRAHRRKLAILEARADGVGVRAELERRVAAKPDDASAWRRLGDVLGSAAAEGDVETFVRALAAYDRADVLAGGSDPEVHEGRARLAARMTPAVATSAFRRRAAELRAK